jgi:hypothetical protein
MMDWVAISAVASALAALSAVAAAFIALFTARETRMLAAQANANTLIKRYLELTIEHPELSTEGSQKDREEQRYSWFVSFILLTVREVLKAYPNDAGWRKLMSDQLSYVDKEELKAWSKDQLVAFGADVHGLVNETLSRKVRS